MKRNRGTSGSDGQTIEAFESQLHEEIKRLKQELENWEYKPKPVRQVEIPKPGNTQEKRLLGVPCVRDRVVQTAIKQLLEPILDPLFSVHSYGFRPGRDQAQAVSAAQKIVQSGKGYTVDIDLSKFFDTVNQDRLLTQLSKIIEDKRIIKLVAMTLRSGAMKEGRFIQTTQGTVQGSPLSPLLSNLVLDELDKELEKRGLEYCRFADDCNIFVKTQKAGERVLESISKFIEKKLKLVINKAKTQVAKSSQVKFLGMTIIEGTVAIAKVAMNKAMDKIKELTPRGTHEKLEKTIEKINEWYMGWSNYYSMTQYPSQFGRLEAHIRRRLRSRIVDQQKSRRNLFNKLVKQGVSKLSAAKAVFHNRKRWELSHTKAVEKAYPNRWFEKKGLKIRSTESRKHWFSIKQWVRLT